LCKSADSRSRASADFARSLGIQGRR
jgi:hypothetical protein